MLTHQKCTSYLIQAAQKQNSVSRSYISSNSDKKGYDKIYYYSDLDSRSASRELKS